MRYQTALHRDAIILTPASAPTASVIWLHGLGADGSDFPPLVPELNLPELLAVRFVFPHAPVRPVTVNGGMPMRAWYDIHGLGVRDREDEAGIRESARTLAALISAERSAGIASERILLAGFSQGGAVVLFGGTRHPERLGGILALSTYLPLASKLQGEAAAANRDLPILMCHGTQDPIVPIEMAQRSYQELKQLSYPIKWQDYPMPHSLCAPEVADISQWIQLRLMS
jgi:phospholipase/carboxylesterase